MTLTGSDIIIGIMTSLRCHGCVIPGFPTIWQETASNGGKLTKMDPLHYLATLSPPLRGAMSSWLLDNSLVISYLQRNTDQHPNND